MKKLIIGIVSITCLAIAPNTQAQSLQDILGTILGDGGVTNSGTSQTPPTTPSNNTPGMGSGLSNLDIGNGLKEALSIGAQSAASKLSMKNGFFRNAAVKILMPKEVQQVDAALRQFGLGNVSDQAILLMNRAAEDAARKAAPIFINAVRQMTLQDAIGILRGNNNAATMYLQRVTQQQLMNEFKPVVQQSLGKVGADRIWNQVFTVYNKLPISNSSINTDLTQYVTQKTTEGMFKMIAEEELKIRKNPLARSTDLLRRVFGSK